MATSYTIKLHGGNQLRVELFGMLDEPSAVLLEGALSREVSKFASGSFSVLFVLAGMSDCTMQARMVLARIQGVLAKKARRTVYLDDRPRFRGMALWVMHLAGDGNAKAVSSPEQARQWLAGTVDRVADAQARVGMVA